MGDRHDVPTGRVDTLEPFPLGDAELTRLLLDFRHLGESARRPDFADRWLRTTATLIGVEAAVLLRVDLLADGGVDVFRLGAFPSPADASEVDESDDPSVRREGKAIARSSPRHTSWTDDGGDPPSPGQLAGVVEPLLPAMMAGRPLDDARPLDAWLDSLGQRSSGRGSAAAPLLSVLRSPDVGARSGDRGRAAVRSSAVAARGEADAGGHRVSRDAPAPVRTDVSATLVAVARGASTAPFPAHAARLLHACHRAVADALPGPAHVLVERSVQSKLSRSEQQTFELLLTGRSEKQIAALLGRSRHTVHSHVKRIYRELGLASRAELFARFLAPSGSPAELAHMRP